MKFNLIYLKIQRLARNPDDGQATRGRLDHKRVKDFHHQRHQCRHLHCRCSDGPARKISGAWNHALSRGCQNRGIQQRKKPQKTWQQSPGKCTHGPK